jgi:DNA-binding IclR family transcriptional regulator
MSKDQIAASADPDPATPGRVAQADAEPGSVRSVRRACALLANLDPTGPHPTLTDFTNRTGLATSTVQRLLGTLESEAMLRRSPDGRYACGPRLMQIAVAALQGMEIYVLAEDHLDNLSRATGETANFAILGEGDHFIYLRQALSPRTIRHANWLGRALPMQGTANGAALTGAVDGRGLAWRRKTIEPDVTAIAAPVIGPGGERVGALSITGPTYRIDDDALAAFAGHLSAEARAFTRQIGGRWPYLTEDGV